MTREQLERCPDALEAAADAQDKFNNRGIVLAQDALAPQTDPSFDGKHCIECPSLIPKARRDTGRIRCVICETQREKKAKVFR